ncbi:MAG: cytochrome c oxidase subunit II [Rhodospirillales bacterium]
MLNRLKLFILSVVMAVAAWSGAVQAAEGHARPWQLNLQDAYSPVMERVHDFNNLLMVIQLLIVLFVLGILGYVIVRFNAKRNPVPSKTAHNTLLEVVLTAVPIVILVIIAIPSMKLLYFSDRTDDYEMTLKVTGHQWYWTYAYPDHGDFSFDSIPIRDEDLEDGQLRLLTVDNRVVLPVDTNIQILITADDVIHAWAIPALGMKVDATPGRVNERWMRINKEGMFYGMCSELCGVNHGFMPIQVEAVSKEAFAEWVEQAKEQFAGTDRPALAVVEADRAAR